MVFKFLAKKNLYTQILCSSAHARLRRTPCSCMKVSCWTCNRLTSRRPHIIWPQQVRQIWRRSGGANL